MNELELLEEQNKILREQNIILRKNTKYTGGGFLVGAVALVIALMALMK